MAGLSGEVPSGYPAGGCRSSLRFLFFRFLNFFFLTSVSFGHNEFLVIVGPQIDKFVEIIQHKKQIRRISSNGNQDGWRKQYEDLRHREAVFHYPTLKV